jgi:hypothetical protein
MPGEHTVLAAPIHDVTVFRQGAVVRRFASLAAGQTTVRIDGLPLCLDDSTVVARIEGTGAPLAMDVRVGLDVTDVDREDPPQQAALDAAREAEARAADQVAWLQRQAVELGSIDPPDRPDGKRGHRPPPVPLEARLALLDFREEQRGLVQTRLAVAIEELRDAKEHRRALADAWKRATTAREPRARELRKVAHVRIGEGRGRQGEGSTDEGGPWRLVLEYRVPGVRWTPSYCLRFDASLDRVELELRAAVAQQTGEDWSGVRLTVSTAHPMSWSELPELPARRIGRRQPNLPRTGWRPAPHGAAALYADYQAATARLTPPAPTPEPASAPHPAFEQAAFEDMDGEDDLGMIEPPLASMAAPPPEPKRRGRARKKAKPSRGGAMPPPSPMPAAAMRSMPVAGGRAMSNTIMASSIQSLGGPGGGGAAFGSDLEEQLEEPELAAPAQLLNYGRLRLGGPDDGARGGLRPATRMQVYQERVQVERIEITRQLITLVDQAVRGADLSALPLPAGHRAPAPIRDFDHAWQATHPVDLASDGGWHTLSLQSAVAPAEVRLVVVPREVTDAFRFATFQNPAESPLPTGPADVFVDGELLLTTTLRATDQGAKVQMGLGVEEGVRVSRNAQFSERSVGILGGSLALDHDVEVTLSNNTGAEARVEVRERLPTLREDDDEVEIKSVRTSPAWEAWEQPDHPIRGSHRWVVQLGAGERRVLKLHYTVEISARKELVGGNRREA